MIRNLFLAAALCGACSSSGSDPSGAQASAGNTGQISCTNVSGAWNVTAHCDPSLVGMSLMVTQTDCALAFAAPFDAFSGSVTAGGKITLSGPQSCTGTATESAISMSCTPAPCTVKLAR